MLSSYSGKIISLVPSKIAKQSITVQSGAAKAQAKIETAEDIEADIKTKLKEIEKLEKELKEHSAEQQEAESGFAQFKASYKLNLLVKEGAHALLIDCQMPIDYILMQSMQNIEILDVPGSTCKVNKVVDQSSALLATLKALGGADSAV